METFHVKTSPHYITGVCEAAAVFTYAKNGSNIVPRFSIKLPGPDKELASLIMRHFACGNIYSSVRRNHQTSAEKTTWSFVATKFDDLEKILSHFEKYPLHGRKGDCYKIWRELVLHKKNFRRSDPLILSDLAKKLSESALSRPRR
jgi:hypothetical protein